MNNHRMVSPLLIALSYLSTWAHAAEPVKNLPLVFDPQTKKYFIGGTSKFVLKQGEDSSLVDRIEVSIDGGEYQTYGDSVHFDNEGKHTLKFRAVNPVNGWSPVQFVEVFVDLTPPSTEAKFLENASYTDGQQTFVQLHSTVSLVSQDNLSGVASIEYSWDGNNFTAYEKPIALEKAGPQTLYYRSTDRVNNAEPVKKLNLVTDAAPPVSTVRMEGPARPANLNGKTYTSDSVAFVVSATDDASQVSQTWVSIDGKKPTIYLKPIYLLQEGPHTLSYYSVDNVGNREKEKTLSVYTVSTAPKTHPIPVGKVVNTGGINYVTNDFQLKLEAQDNVVGLDRIEVKIDDESNFKPYLEPLRFNTLGRHTVSYRAVDRAGNIEPARVYNVDIHLQAPETTLATAQPVVVRNGVQYSPAPNIVTLNVGNSVVGVENILVSLNDSPFAPYHGPITLNSDKKVQKISYKSLDKLGNEEPVKTVTYHMMGSTPVVDLFISNGQSTEEQVRTNYLDGASQPASKTAPAPTRGVATEKSTEKKSP